MLKIFYLLHEKDENLSENLDEVNEEIQGVGNEVSVSIPGLPDNQLGVEHDEATENRQTDPDVSLIKLRIEERNDKWYTVQLFPLPGREAEI